MLQFYNKENCTLSIVQVRFPSGAIVNLGNSVAASQTRDAPTEFSWPVNRQDMYTIVMTSAFESIKVTNESFFSGPLSGRAGEQRMHWMVINVPGTDWQRGDTVFEYIPVGAAPRSGVLNTKKAIQHTFRHPPLRFSRLPAALRTCARSITCLH